LKPSLLQRKKVTGKFRLSSDETEFITVFPVKRILPLTREPHLNSQINISASASLSGGSAKNAKNAEGYQFPLSLLHVSSLKVLPAVVICWLLSLLLSLLYFEKPLSFVERDKNDMIK